MSAGHTTVTHPGIASRSRVVPVDQLRSSNTVRVVTPPLNRDYHLVNANSRSLWTFDWGHWLFEGETIVSWQWSISPAATLDNAQSEIVFVSGLMAGRTYQLTARVTNNAGATQDRSITLRAE